MLLNQAPQSREPALFVAADVSAVDRSHPAAAQPGAAHRLRRQPDRSGLPDDSIRRATPLELVTTARHRCARALAELAWRLPGCPARAGRRRRQSRHHAHRDDALVSSSQSARAPCRRRRPATSSSPCRPAARRSDRRHGAMRAPRASKCRAVANRPRRASSSALPRQRTGYQPRPRRCSTRRGCAAMDRKIIARAAVVILLVGSRTCLRRRIGSARDAALGSSTSVADGNMRSARR